MLAHCEDADVIGAPFYVMAKADGTPYGRAEQLKPLGADRTRAITEQLVDTLATLHSVDYAAVGLSDFGRPDGYLERQVSRWKKQLAASTSRELPGMDELIAQLDSNIPTTSDGTIVHGDYRLDNVLVDDSDQHHGRARLGDEHARRPADRRRRAAGLPAARRGGSPVEHRRGAWSPMRRWLPATSAAHDILERYATKSGRDVSNISFHLSLAFFKLAVILEGIHFRHSAGPDRRHRLRRHRRHD